MLESTMTDELFDEKPPNEKQKVERIPVASYLSPEDGRKLAFLVAEMGKTKSEVIKRLIRFGYSHAVNRKKSGAA